MESAGGPVLMLSFALKRKASRGCGIDNETFWGNFQFIGDESC